MLPIKLRGRILCVCVMLLVSMLLPQRIAAAEGLTLETEPMGAILTDVSGQEPLYELYADVPYDVAGLAKLPAILTLCQAIDEGLIRADTEMTVSTRAANISGPTAFLEEGEPIRASELIKAAIMISAGDAIMALGENAYGSENVFIENIHATLRLCGLEKNMTDACGTGMQFSAKELALLGAAALESETFQKYCALYREVLLHTDGRQTELVNANRLVRSYNGCKGLITGSSGTSTYCGVFAAERGGTGFVAVVIGAESANDRFTVAETMLNYGFSNYVSRELSRAGTVVAENVPVHEGTEKTVNLVTRDDARVLLPKASEQDLREERDIPVQLEAPIDPTQQVGSIRWLNAAGEVLATVPLYADRAADAFGWKDVFSEIAVRFLGG